MPAMHELKIAQEYFRQQADGTKTFELRFDDRGFQIGGLILLREYAHPHYTGRQLTRNIVGLLWGPVLGLASGWAILSTTGESPAA